MIKIFQIYLKKIRINQIRLGKKIFFTIDTDLTELTKNVCQFLIVEK